MNYVLNEDEIKIIRWGREHKFKYIFKLNDLIVVSSNLPITDGDNYKVGVGSSCIFTKKTEGFEFINNKDIYLLKNLLENDLHPLELEKADISYMNIY